METYQTVRDMFNLLQTISGNGELKEKWSWLHQWDRLDAAGKMEKYEEWMCHEVDLFLYFKDRPWFDRVAKRLIACKLHKDAIDLFLCGDVEALRDRYSMLSAFERLNPLERVLVAAAVPELKERTLRYFKDRDATLKVDPQRMDRLFQTALASKALQDDAASKQMQKEERRAMMGMMAGGAPRSRAKMKKMKKSAAAPRQYENERRAMADRALYRNVDRTKEYQETYYHGVRYERDTAQLVPWSKFWCGFAAYFLSDDVDRDTTSFVTDYVVFPTGYFGDCIHTLF